MPIYEYRCLDCDRIFDKLRSISRADDPIACAYCESFNTRRARITPFMALSKNSTTGERSSLAGTLEGCKGPCASCGRPCSR